MHHWSSSSNSKPTSVCNPQGQEGLALLEGKKSISSGSGQRDSGSLGRRGWRVLAVCICRFCSPRSPAWQMDYLPPSHQGSLILFHQNTNPSRCMEWCHSKRWRESARNALSEEAGEPKVCRGPDSLQKPSLQGVPCPVVAGIHMADAVLSASPACRIPHCTFVKEAPQPDPVCR